MEFLLNKQNEQSIWTKNFVLVVIANLMTFSIHFITLATLPLYAIVLGGDNLGMGLVTSMYFVAALLVRPFSGKALDQHGRRGVLILGMIVTIISHLLLFLSESVSMLLLLRLVNGAGYSLVSTATGTFVTDIVPKKRLAEGIGYYSGSLTIAIAFGPAIGLNVLAWFGYQALFSIIALLGLAALIIVLNIDFKSNSGNIPPIYHANTAAHYYEKKALPFGFIMFLISISVSGIITFLPVFAVERGIANVSFFFFVYAFALFLPRVLMGKIVERFGNKIIVFSGMLATMLCLVFLIKAHDLRTVLLSAVLFGLGYGLLQPIFNSIVIWISPEDSKGAANATYFAMLDIGFCLGTALWGYVSEAHGFGIVYLLSAIIVGLTYLIYLLLTRKARVAHKFS